MTTTPETRVVPVEPDEEMLAAGEEAMCDTIEGDNWLNHCRNAWRAMIAAAPAAPAPEQAANGSATPGKVFPDEGNNVPVSENTAPAPEPVAFQTLTAGKWVECSEFVAKGWGDTLADGCRALYAAPPTPVAASAVDAIQFIEKRRDDYVRDYGIYDPETGQTEFPSNGNEYVGELEEIIDGLRAAAEGNR